MKNSASFELGAVISTKCSDSATSSNSSSTQKHLSLVIEVGTLTRKPVGTKKPIRQKAYQLMCAIHVE
jgi:hypothetical protein